MQTPSGVVLAAAAQPKHLEAIGKLAAGLVRDGDRVGLGSGRAAMAFVNELGLRVKVSGLKCVAVPTGIATEKLALKAGVPLAALNEVDAIDIAVDGADEVAPGLALLKGGGGNILRERLVECIAKRLIILVGEEKLVPRLGTNFPVFLEVIEFGRVVVTRKLETEFGATVTQRMDLMGKPFLTDDGNPYLHVTFPPPMLDDPAALSARLRSLPGVVESGIFLDMATEAYIAKFDGSIEHRKQGDGQ